MVVWRFLRFFRPALLSLRHLREVAESTAARRCQLSLSGTTWQRNRRGIVAEWRTMPVTIASPLTRFGLFAARLSVSPTAGGTSAVCSPGALSAVATHVSLWHCGDDAAPDTPALNTHAKSPSWGRLVGGHGPSLPNGVSVSSPMVAGDGPFSCARYVADGRKRGESVRSVRLQLAVEKAPYGEANDTCVTGIE